MNSFHDSSFDFTSIEVHCIIFVLFKVVYNYLFDWVGKFVIIPGAKAIIDNIFIKNAFLLLWFVLKWAKSGYPV